MILFLSGCRTKETADPPSEASVSETTASKDQPLDLTKLSSTMVYSEFVLAGEHTYPDDYPKEGEEITVTGIFDIYEEDGFKYCQLINASMEQ